MGIKFYKYHGTGNDFVMMDARSDDFPWESFDVETRSNICHRRFGIGADGLIFLKKSSNADFEMVYFNSDGRPSSMCGNGGRCIVQMAHDLGLVNNTIRFMAVDGPHHAMIGDGRVSLQMNTGEVTELANGDFTINTGSPHYVRFVDDVKEVDVFRVGREIRQTADYREEGINVNFVERNGPHDISMATYERGVEDETYSCGTGVTGSALVELHCAGVSEGEVNVQTKGGDLSVVVKSGGHAREVWLTGPAVRVFEGFLDPDRFRF